MKRLRVVNFRYSENFYGSHDYVDYVFWKRFLERIDIPGTISHPNVDTGDELDQTFKYRDQSFFSLIHRLVSCIGSSNLIVQSFEEYLMFFWVIIWRIVNPKGVLYLVATNNITHKRLSKIYVRYFYKLISLLGIHVVLHSRSERDILFQYARPRVILKRYHMWMEVLGLEDVDRSSNDDTLFYPGPVKVDKPVRYLLEFLKSQVTVMSMKISSIVLLNCRIDELSEGFDCASFDNVSWLDLRELYSKSSLIFLPHDRTYEGKLSGNLIDAIFFEKPIVSNSINPVLEYFTEFGDLGVIYNYDEGFDIPLFDYRMKNVHANLRLAKECHKMKTIYNKLVIDLDL